MTLSQTLRANLRQAITSHPSSIDDLAVKAGYSESYVQRVLAGSRGNPTILFVESMAQAMDMEPLDLLVTRG